MAKKNTIEDLYDKNMFRSHDDLMKALEYIESVPEDNRSEAVRLEQKAIQDIILFKYDPQLKQQAKKLVQFLEKFDSDHSSEKTLKELTEIHKRFDKRLNELFNKFAPGKILGNDQQQPLVILSMCKHIKPVFDYLESGGGILDQISSHQDSGHLQYFLTQVCSSVTYIQAKKEPQGNQESENLASQIKKIFLKLMEYLMKPHGIHFLRSMENTNATSKNHSFFHRRNRAEKNESQDIEMDVIRDHSKGKSK